MSASGKVGKDLVFRTVGSPNGQYGVRNLLQDRSQGVAK